MDLDCFFCHVSLLSHFIMFTPPQLIQSMSETLLKKTSLLVAAWNGSYPEVYHCHQATPGTCGFLSPSWWFFQDQYGGKILYILHESVSELPHNSHRPPDGTDLEMIKVSSSGRWISPVIGTGIDSNIKYVLRIIKCPTILMTLGTRKPEVRLKLLGHRLWLLVIYLK